MGGLCDLTPLQRRILRFFQEQPHAVESLRGISGWIGAAQGLVGEAVEDLLSRRWLVADETSAVKAYCLTRDERLLAEIGQETAPVEPTP